jgi:peptidoglycan hydrolase CwlO-like protein
MPFVIAIPYIIGAVGTLLCIGGAAYGVDQHVKRKKEQEMFRAELARMKKHMDEKEADLAKLRKRFGEKCDQVRKMAAEIERLREEIAAMERKAA